MEIAIIKAMVVNQLPRTYEALLLTFYGNDAYVDQVQLFSKLEERCLAIDEAALSAEDTWWTVVLEQSKNGLL
jgi:hypothetical protein